MEYLFVIIILIFSVIIHEIAHGGIAYYLGDPTAKYAGRLTLNPLNALVFGLILRLFPGLFVIEGLVLMFSYIVYINILLAVFNLIPVPPLDGSHILFAFLPSSAESTKIFLNQFGFMILLFILLFFSPWLSYIINL